MGDAAFMAASAEETEAFAARVAAGLTGGDRLLLHGDLGGGKTTFVRGLVRGLGHPDPREVASPTYALHHRYEGGSHPVDHLDLYRLEGVEDAMEWQGILDPLDDPDAVAVIEWPDRLPWRPDGVVLEVRFSPGPTVDQRLVRPTFLGQGEIRLQPLWPQGGSLEPE